MLDPGAVGTGGGTLDPGAVCCACAWATRAQAPNMYPPTKSCASVKANLVSMTPSITQRNLRISAASQCSPRSAAPYRGLPRSQRRYAPQSSVGEAFSRKGAFQCILSLSLLSLLVCTFSE